MIKHDIHKILAANKIQRCYRAHHGGKLPASRVWHLISEIGIQPEKDSGYTYWSLDHIISSQFLPTIHDIKLYLGSLKI